MKETPRISYLDNIRILLTAIVIFHHLVITYGAPGGWYYKEFTFAQLDIVTLILLVLVTAANQAFFMGFFFFLSGYFSARSIQNKTSKQFLAQRFIRLGLPILIFVYLFSPLLRISLSTILYQQALTWDSIQSVYQNLKFGTELGPMWFIMTLLVLSILCLHAIKWDLFNDRLNGLPHAAQIVIFALLLGGLTYVVRIFQPVGSVFQPLNLQLPHTLQYISLFLIGTIAYHNHWLEKIDGISTTPWLFFILGLVMVMPLLFILSGGLEGNLDPALGGMHWQSLAYSLWEQLFCVSLIVTLLAVFKKHLSSSNRFWGELAASSYAAYLIHPLVLVIYAALIQPITLHPLLKISLSMGPVLFFCFLAAAPLRRLPGMNKLL